MPLYPVYALLFADSGMSVAQISGLFVLWSVVGVVAEVPCGAWADQHSRRTAIVAAGVLQAAGHLAWIVWPAIGGFALGFVLWGIGGALSSGSIQALVFDGLSAEGAAGRYAAVMGRAEAAAIAVQVPLALVAGALFEVGGYPLLGIASVAVCLCAAGLATRLPEAPRVAADDGEEEPGFAETLRSGVAEALGSPPVRVAALAVAVFSGFDAIEEYFALLASEWGVPTGGVPVAMLPISLAGALGAVVAVRALGPAGARADGGDAAGRRGARGVPWSQPGPRASPGSPSTTGCCASRWSWPTPGCRRGSREAPGRRSPPSPRSAASWSPSPSSAPGRSAGSVW